MYGYVWICMDIYAFLMYYHIKSYLCDNNSISYKIIYVNNKTSTLHDNLE